MQEDIVELRRITIIPKIISAINIRDNKVKVQVKT
jgi:hypothetical protein